MAEANADLLVIAWQQQKSIMPYNQLAMCMWLCECVALCLIRTDVCQTYQCPKSHQCSEFRFNVIRRHQYLYNIVCSEIYTSQHNHKAIQIMYIVK